MVLSVVRGENLYSNRVLECEFDTSVPYTRESRQKHAWGKATTRHERGRGCTQHTQFAKIERMDAIWNDYLATY